MKSSSAGPDFVWMSLRRAATDAALYSFSSVTTAGSVSIVSAPWPGGVQSGPSSGTFVF